MATLRLKPIISDPLILKNLNKTGNFVLFPINRNSYNTIN